MPDRISVVSVDDHGLIRQAIATQLVESPAIDLVAQGSLGCEVIPLVEKHHPKVLLLDIGMPQNENGSTRFRALPAIAQLRQTYPEMAIVILTQHISYQIIWGAANLGVQGYIDKADGITDELADTIMTVHRGGIVFSSTAQRLLVQANANAHIDVPTLTDRQLDVLKAVFTTPDHSNMQNAKALGMSEATFKTHLRNIFKAFDVSSKTAAIVSGIQFGILQTEWLEMPKT